MNIKAYAWDDEDYGGSYFVWTTTPGKAKALLAAEHDREFTEIRVYRVPWADKYGDNKIIPAKELLSNGWWLYCSNCGTRVQNDTATVLDAVEVLCDECAKDWNEKEGKMKIEDLKVGRVYRAKRPRVVHTLGGSYINDRQILSISPFEETIQYDSPKVGFGSKYPVISVEKFLKWAAKDITDDLPPDEWEEYKRCKMESKYMTLRVKI